jgi:hypothetical protein
MAMRGGRWGVWPQPSFKPTPAEQREVAGVAGAQPMRGGHWGASPQLFFKPTPAEQRESDAQPWGILSLADIARPSS